MSNDVFEDDEYTTEEDQYLEAQTEKMLIEWRARASDAQHAKEWLHTNFGKRVIKLCKANQLAAMKKAATAETQDEVMKAQLDYKVYCQVETVIGSIIMQGHQAIAELEAKEID